MKRPALFFLAVPLAGAAQAQDSLICTDRPTKANAVCTVPVGRVQLETSAIAWSRTDVGDDRSEFLAVAPSFVRVGLTDQSEVQIGLTPFARLTTRSEGATRRLSGVGDVLARYKHRLTGDDAPVQLALIPFLKIPTARSGLGNDKVEGGVAVPISFALAGPVTMTLGPEFDVLADSDGEGSHLALVNLVNLSLPVAPRLTFAGELWTNINFDPARRIEQASADAALAYAVSNDLQLDLGANLGLTADTADLELYAGISFRF